MEAPQSLEEAFEGIRTALTRLRAIGLELDGARLCQLMSATLRAPTAEELQGLLVKVPVRRCLFPGGGHGQPAGDTDDTAPVQASPQLAQSSTELQVPATKEPPMARVEVALHEEEMASWYQGTVLQETKSRSNVRLLVVPQAMGGSGADGENQFLFIKGRKEEESVGKDDVRPLPPVDRSWTPTVGENCELLYLDGWWPVRVVQQLRGDKWIVMFEAFGVQHTVPRSQLRKKVAWDAATQTWKGAAK